MLQGRWLFKHRFCSWRGGNKKKNQKHTKRKLHPPATPLFKTKRFVQLWRSGDPHRKLVMISNPPPITDWSVMTLKPWWLRHRPEEQHDQAATPPSASDMANKSEVWMRGGASGPNVGAGEPAHDDGDVHGQFWLAGSLQFEEATPVVELCARSKGKRGEADASPLVLLSGLWP